MPTYDPNDDEQRRPQPAAPPPGTAPTIAPPTPRAPRQTAVAQPARTRPPKADPVAQPTQTKPAEQPIGRTSQYGQGPNANPILTMSPESFGFGGEQASAPPAAQATTQTFGFGSAAAPVGGVANSTETGINSAINDPSRYSADVVKQGASVIEQSLAKLRKQGQQSIAENAASRGLVGSSVEQQNMLEYEADLQRQGQERLFNLQREQANTYGADRNSALGLGLGFGDQSLSMLGMGMDNDYRYAAMNQDAGFRNQMMSLQAQGMSADDAYRHAALAWQQQYGGQELDLRRHGVNSQYTLALAELSQRYPDLDLSGLLPPGSGGGPGGAGNTNTNTGTGTNTSQQFTWPDLMTKGGNQELLRNWAGNSSAQPTSSSLVAPNLNGGGGGQPGGAQTWAQQGREFGFTPQPLPGQPNYGIVNEAQRRLGITQTAPMPNGVTSPMPGGGGNGGGGARPNNPPAPPNPDGTLPGGHPKPPPPAGGSPRDSAPAIPAYNPASGPPTRMGVETPENEAAFQRQSAQYAAYLQSQGLTDAQGGNTQTYTTNGPTNNMNIEQLRGQAQRGDPYAQRKLERLLAAQSNNFGF